MRVNAVRRRTLNTKAKLGTGTVAMIVVFGRFVSDHVRKIGSVYPWRRGKLIYSDDNWFLRVETTKGQDTMLYIVRPCNVSHLGPLFMVISLKLLDKFFHAIVVWRRCSVSRIRLGTHTNSESEVVNFGAIFIPFDKHFESLSVLHVHVWFPKPGERNSSGFAALRRAFWAFERPNRCLKQYAFRRCRFCAFLEDLIFLLNSRPHQQVHHLAAVCPRLHLFFNIVPVKVSPTLSISFVESSPWNDDGAA
mmetsp:Transcript_19920/g.29489  ORF Transcript_19920/g.29489 Transcript_19920/m.29489 type:complete len:249 (+) Transcript_19920:493-1239(+)